MKASNVHDELISSYHSSHYREYMPKTNNEWEWVLERFELNYSSYLAHLTVTDKILDLPCGVGYLEHYLIRKGYSDIIAVDLSSEQIDVAKSVMSQRGVDYQGKVKFVVKDAFEFLSKDEKYKAIFLIDIIEHFSKEDVFKLIKCAADSLEDDGLLFIRTPNAEYPMFGRFYNDLTHITPFTIKSLSQLIRVSMLTEIHNGFEVVPFSTKNQLFFGKIKEIVFNVMQGLLGKILGVKKGGFSENIVCVVKK